MRSLFLCYEDGTGNWRRSCVSNTFYVDKNGGGGREEFSGEKQVGIIIYAPMIYTAPCVMFLIRADTLRGQVGGGWALEIVSFLGPVKWHRADRRVPFGEGGGGVEIWL